MELVTEKEIKRVNKAELAGLSQAAGRVAQAQQALDEAQKVQREMLTDVGLDPNRTYRIAPDGGVFDMEPPPEEAQTAETAPVEPMPIDRAARRRAAKAK